MPASSPLSGCDQLNSRGWLAVARPVSCCGYDKAVGSWNRVPRPHRESVLWRCPTLPHPPRCSTIGACGLSFQVRNGCWAFPRGYDHHKMVQPYLLLNTPTVAGRVWRVGVCVGCDPHSGDEHPWMSVNLLWLMCVFSVGPLVPVGSRAPRGASTSGLSTR